MQRPLAASRPLPPPLRRRSQPRLPQPWSAVPLCNWLLPDHAHPAWGRRALQRAGGHPNEEKGWCVPRGTLSRAGCLPDAACNAREALRSLNLPNFRVHMLRAAGSSGEASRAPGPRSASFLGGGSKAVTMKFSKSVTSSRRKCRKASIGAMGRGGAPGRSYLQGIGGRIGGSAWGPPRALPRPPAPRRRTSRRLPACAAS